LISFCHFVLSQAACSILGPISPFKRVEKSAIAGTSGKGSDSPLPVLHENENEEDEEEMADAKAPGTAHTYRSPHGAVNSSQKANLSSLMKNFSSEDLTSGNESIIGGFGQGNNLFDSKNPTSNIEELNNDGSSFAAASSALSTLNPLPNLQEGMKKLFSHTHHQSDHSSSPVEGLSASSSAVDLRIKETLPSSNSSSSLTAGNSFNNSSSVTSSAHGGGIGGSSEKEMSTNEKQLTSQDKSIIRHRFDDYDDRGNLTCKFQCQVFYSKQFEALRCCYFDEDNSDGCKDNFIRSLAMSARWSAQGN
jgi:hypothetical protein